MANTQIISFESTPNPNAVKCILSGPLTGRETGNPASFTHAEAARADPLADALFALEGVTGVLLMRDWLTVNKRPDAEWKSLKPKIKRAVERWGSGDSGAEHGR